MGKRAKWAVGIAAALIAPVVLLVSSCSASTTGTAEAEAAATTRSVAQTPEAVMKAIGCEGTLNTDAPPQSGVIATYRCQNDDGYVLDNIRFLKTAGDTQAYLEDLRKNVPTTMLTHTVMAGSTWILITDVSERIAAAVNFGGEIMHS